MLLVSGVVPSVLCALAPGAGGRHKQTCFVWDFFFNFNISFSLFSFVIKVDSHEKWTVG